MLYDKELLELKKISQAVGNAPDLVQGGGGNTSVKLDDRLMAVKASGFRLNQITPSEGYVAVDYKAIQEYYRSVDLSLDNDYEKESVEFAKSSVLPIGNMKILRPSVEAGFHSILGKYVIHTHPVYVNVLCCSHNGRELMERLLSVKSYGSIWIPYINPGFCLTLKIIEGIRAYTEKLGGYPEVIFMENHGLIVTSDDVDRCLEIHKDVNETIKKFLDIGEGFPEIVLEQDGDQVFSSRTKHPEDFFNSNIITPEYFNKIALYPDQLVYLNGKISVNSADNKLNINTKTGEITYNTNLSEAKAMEETLTGYIFVLTVIKRNNLPLKTLSEKDIEFINNWESESYRKSLSKKLI